MTNERSKSRPDGSSTSSGTKTFDVKRPVRFDEKSQLHFTKGQQTTMKRAARKSS